MKKVLLILIMLLYLVSVIGITISAHYCGGTLASVSFSFEKGEQCACGDDAMNDGCCKNESKTFKIKDTQQKPIPSSVNTDNWFIALAVLSEPNYQIQPLFVGFVSDIHHHPPDVGQKSLFLLNSTFRI